MLGVRWHPLLTEPASWVVTLDTLRALHEHDHELAAYDPPSAADVLFSTSSG